MTNETPGIDDKALESLAVAPDGTSAPAQGDAGSDDRIADRIEDAPEDSDARLDAGLDESMDASDPIASTQPSGSDGPAPSSGYDAEEEARRATD